MKKIVFMAVITAFAAVVNAAPDSSSFKENSLVVSEAFCNKMEECSKEKIPLKNCVADMHDMFNSNYEALPKKKKFELSTAESEQCTKSIKGSSCEELKSAQKLTGCDFIEKLSR